jgi:molybdopterin molybdotransferase
VSVVAAKPIELERARELVLARARPLAAEPVPLREALGRRLAEDAVATEAVPAFDNSAMDGYAVRAANTREARAGAPVALRLAGGSRAGHPAGVALGAGEAIAISTGAVLPAGADAVVRVEATRREGDRVLVEGAVAAGRDVRRAGEDIGVGELVLEAGGGIGPAELGALASLGFATVSCRRRPRVAVLTSGDELLEPGEPMRPGGVRNSNAHSVPALARLAGAEVDVAASVADDPGATRAAIEPALESDVAVVCGGVSVGEHDHVKGALAELGAEQRFWGVSLKPGRPTWFGTRGETLIFGLPGNPVSAMVTFVLLVRPALVALAGGRPERQRTTAVLASDCEKHPGRTHAVRCRLELSEEGWRAHPFERQGSHVLTSMLGADCLALLPSAAGTVRAGERVEVELLDLAWGR